MCKMLLGSPGHDFISDISVDFHDVRAGVKPSTWLPPEKLAEISQLLACCEQSAVEPK